MYNAPITKAQITSNWVLEGDNDFTVLQLPQSFKHSTQSQERHTVDEQLKSLFEAIVSMWIKMSDFGLYFLFVVQCKTKAIWAVLKPKGDLTQYYQSIPNKKYIWTFSPSGGDPFVPKENPNPDKWSVNRKKMQRKVLKRWIHCHGDRLMTKLWDKETERKARAKRQVAGKKRKTEKKGKHNNSTNIF